MSKATIWDFKTGQDESKRFHPICEVHRPRIDRQSIQYTSNFANFELKSLCAKVLVPIGKAWRCKQLQTFLTTGNLFLFTGTKRSFRFTGDHILPIYPLPSDVASGLP
ncbi:MAG: hypothetical protein WA354_15080 [Terracidiphilus sp.]